MSTTTKLPDNLAAIAQMGTYPLVPLDEHYTAADMLREIEMTDSIVQCTGAYVMGTQQDIDGHGVAQACGLGAIYIGAVAHGWVNDPGVKVHL